MGAAAAMLLALPAAAGPAAPAAAPSRASVLLITLDTTRADRLGCYGYEAAATPALDALARAGTLFENAISPTPLTLPSHASLLTGLAPRRHGVRDNAVFRLGDEPPTLASLLRDRGYETAAAIGAAVLDRSTGIGRGFQVYDDQVRIRNRQEFNYLERSAAHVTDAALEILAGLRAPFFLWVHYYDPHHPYVPPSPYREGFRDSPYDGEIAFMDAQIDRLLRAVGRKSPPSKTLVIVAGDHGESLGEHGEDRHDLFIYQATQRVPLILAGPGVEPGRRITTPAGLVDLLPTTLDLLRIPAPGGLDGRSLAAELRARAASPPSTGAGERALAAADGPSKASELRPPEPHAYEIESFFPAYAYNWAPPVGLVFGRWKYIGVPRPELYDIQDDAGEIHNLLDGALGALAAGAPIRPPVSDGGEAAGGGRRPQDLLAVASGLAAELRQRFESDPVARAFDAPPCLARLEPSCISGPARPAAGGAAPSVESAPPTTTAGSRTIAASEETAAHRERLAALGYAGGTVVPSHAPPRGPRLDPKEGAPIVRELDRARALLEAGAATEAIRLLEPLARRDPANFPVLASLGAALAEAGAFDRAIEIHRRTVALRPDYEQTHANLAGALRAKAASLDGARPGLPAPGPPVAAAAALREEAARAYETALRLRARDSESYLAFARLELERSRAGAALAVLGRADAAGAGDPEIYLLLGRLRAASGDQPAARAAFEEALRLDGRSSEAHEALGKLDYLAGEARSAARHYAHALDLSPSAALARTLGAILLNDLADVPGAIAAFRRALALSSGPDEAAEIEALLRDLEASR